jgi:hypothetical protein
VQITIGSRIRNRQSHWVVFVFLLAAAAVQAQEVLTNDTVVNMTKAHLDAATIIDMIQKNPGKYVVTSSALIALKQQGVSDGAIAAMRAKMAGTPAALQNSAPAPRGTPAPTGEAQCRTNTPLAPKWLMCDWKDPITGESQFEANTRQTFGRAESSFPRFDVTATCAPIGLAFKIVYHSDSDSKIGYKLSDGDFLFPKPHVIMRLSLDGSSGSAPSPTTDFTNEATLLFQRKLSDAEKKAVGVGGTIVLGITSLASPAEPAEVYKARLLTVELPLSNGDLPILEIQPQDAEFQRFAARCNVMVDNSARARKEEEKRAQEQKEQETIQNAGPIVRKYGMPSISDSHDTLVGKALELKDVRLQGYWNSTNRDPIDEHKGTGRGLAAASGVPGSACGTIFDPGDVDQNSINWETIDTQFVVVRCRDQKRNRVWGQMELTRAGLEELKRRRAQLLELGVKDIPAASEPDTPAGPRPERWTKDSWASRKFYVCPLSRFFPNPSGPPPFVPQQPTLIQLVAHPGTFYYLGKPKGEGAISYEFKWDTLRENADSCPPSSGENTPAGPATLTITGSFAKPLKRGEYWLIDDPLAALNQAGVGVPAGTTPSKVLQTACDHGEATCNKVMQSLNANAASRASSDATGKAALPSLPAGRHYLVLYAAYDDHVSLSFQMVDLKPGPNSVTFTPVLRIP